MSRLFISAIACVTACNKTTYAHVNKVKNAIFTGRIQRVRSMATRQMDSVENWGGVRHLNGMISFTAETQQNISILELCLPDKHQEIVLQTSISDCAGSKHLWGIYPVIRQMLFQGHSRRIFNQMEKMMRNEHLYITTLDRFFWWYFCTPSCVWAQNNTITVC